MKGKMSLSLFWRLKKTQILFAARTVPSPPPPLYTELLNARFLLTFLV